MSDPLFVQPDCVRSYAQIHDEVVASLSQLMGTAAPEAAGLQTSHGAIASAVSTALSSVLGDRHGTMQATSTSGSTISELLQKAAQMYEHGDQKGAETLKAAATALEGSQGAGAPRGASGAGGGGDMAGQMVSRVGQRARSLAATRLGIAQGLQQGSQQVRQGVGQLTPHGGGVGPTGIPSTGSGQGPVSNATPDRGQDDQKQRAENIDEPIGAAPGEAGGTGRAPETPRAERPQTRPRSG